MSFFFSTDIEPVSDKSYTRSRVTVADGVIEVFRQFVPVVPGGGDRTETFCIPATSVAYVQKAGFMYIMLHCGSSIMLGRLRVGPDSDALANDDVVSDCCRAILTAGSAGALAAGGIERPA